jgi:hypothetical protein
MLRIQTDRIFGRDRYGNRGGHARSIVCAVGRFAISCAGAGGEAGATAADTARQSYRRHSPTSSRVVAATAAVAACDHRAITTCSAEEDAGSDKRLIQVSNGIGSVTLLQKCRLMEGLP